MFFFGLIVGAVLTIVVLVALALNEQDKDKGNKNV